MTSDAASPLINISHEILAAIQSRDRVALERVLLDDFAHIDETGRRHSRTDFIEAILSAGYQIERLSFDAIAVELIGDIAIVCGVQRGTVALDGGQRVEGRTAFTDIFLRGVSGWRLRLATSAELPAE